MTGRTAIVTGGTDGIGKEVARGLARRGVRVLVVGRDPDKGARAERELRDSTGNPVVEFLPADLSLVREANRLADEVAGRCVALHYLVHSAGIVRGRRELTAEGVESNFAVNYLGRFALTGRLLPLLESSGRPGGAARVVIVARTPPPAAASRRASSTVKTSLACWNCQTARRVVKFEPRLTSG